MHMKIIAASLVLIVTPVFADDAGFFMAGSAGRIHANTDVAPGFSANDSYSTWALGGGYKANRYVGVEGSYRDLGRRKVEGFGVWRRDDLTGWTYGGFVAYPMTDDVELTARGGWIRWRSEWTNSVGNGGTDTGTELYWGVGATWMLDARMSAVLNWMKFNSPSAYTDDARMVEVGFQYKF
jgi:hypothetical protein